MPKAFNLTLNVNSDTEFTEVYGFGIATTSYDLEDDAVKNDFREFVVNNKDTSDGIVKCQSSETGYMYHSGKGDETFTGTLPVIYDSLDVNTEKNIDEGDDNLLYCAMSLGINRSIWTISQTKGVGNYFMVLYNGSTQQESNNRMVLSTTRGHAQSYVVTSVGTFRIDQNTTYIRQNVVMSSQNRGYDYDTTDDHISSATWNGEGTMKEFMLFKVDDDSKITGFRHGSYDERGWRGYNIEVRQINHKGNFPEFDAAVRNKNAFIIGQSFNNYPNYTDILDMFPSENIVSSQNNTGSTFSVTFPTS